MENKAKSQQIMNLSSNDLPKLQKWIVTYLHCPNYLVPVEMYENIFDCLGPQLGILSMSSMIHEESELLFHRKVKVIHQWQ